MKPVSNAHVVVRSPQRGLLAVLVLALVTAGAGDALAQPRGGGGKADKGAKGDKGRSGGDPGDAGDKKGGKPKVFDFTGIDISGRLRTPQLLYFLDRAAEGGQDGHPAKQPTPGGAGQRLCKFIELGGVHSRSGRWCDASRSRRSRSSATHSPYRLARGWAIRKKT